MVVEKAHLGKKEASSPKNIGQTEHAAATADDTGEPPKAQKAAGLPETKMRWVTPVGSSLKTQSVPEAPLPKVHVSAAKNVEARRKARRKYRRPHSSRTPQRTTRNIRRSHQSARSRFSNTRSVHCSPRRSCKMCPSATLPTKTSMSATTTEAAGPPRKSRRSALAFAVCMTTRTTSRRSRMFAPSTSGLCFIRGIGHCRPAPSCSPRRGTRSVFADPGIRRRLRPCALTPGRRGVPSDGERSVPAVPIDGEGLRHERSCPPSSWLRDVTDAAYGSYCEASPTTEEHVAGRYRHDHAYHRRQVEKAFWYVLMFVTRSTVATCTNGVNSLHVSAVVEPLLCRQRRRLQVRGDEERCGSFGGTSPRVVATSESAKPRAPYRCSAENPAGDAMTRATSGTTVPGPASHHQAQHDMPGTTALARHGYNGAVLPVVVRKSAV